MSLRRFASNMAFGGFVIVCCVVGIAVVREFIAEGRVPEVSVAAPEAKAQEPRQPPEKPQPEIKRAAAAVDAEEAEKPFDIRDLMADMEVIEIDQQRFDGPTKSGYLELESPSRTVFKMRVDNFRGPPGNFCVDILWFDASGLLDGEVACGSAPNSGPDIRTFTTVVAPGIPDGAELKLAFRGRYSTDFGDRIPFRGAEERRAPAIYTVIGGPIACDTFSDLEYLALAPDTPDNRALAFTMVKEGRCAAWTAGTVVDVLGIRGDFALARAQGDGLNIMWILWSSLE